MLAGGEAGTERFEPASLMWDPRELGPLVLIVDSVAVAGAGTLVVDLDWGTDGTSAGSYIADTPQAHALGIRPGRRADVTMGGLRRTVGQALIEVRSWEVCQGAGQHLAWARDAAASVSDGETERRRAAVEAVRAGASKSAAARAAGISRPHLDKLLAEP